MRGSRRYPAPVVERPFHGRARIRVASEAPCRAAAAASIRAVPRPQFDGVAGPSSSSPRAEKAHPATRSGRLPHPDADYELDLLRRIGRFPRAVASSEPPPRPRASRRRRPSRDERSRAEPSVNFSRAAAARGSTRGAALSSAASAKARRSVARALARFHRAGCAPCRRRQPSARPRRLVSHAGESSSSMAATRPPHRPGSWVRDPGGAMSFYRGASAAHRKLVVRAPVRDPFSGREVDSRMSLL